MNFTIDAHHCYDEAALAEALEEHWATTTHHLCNGTCAPSLIAWLRYNGATPTGEK